MCIRDSHIGVDDGFQSFVADQLDAAVPHRLVGKIGRRVGENELVDAIAGIGAEPHADLSLIHIFSEVPEIDVELINTKDEAPLGVGEATAGPTAAAIGNAVSHALGARIRDLPLTRDRIMATLLKE